MLCVAVQLCATGMGLGDAARASETDLRPGVYALRGEQGAIINLQADGFFIYTAFGERRVGRLFDTGGEIHLVFSPRQRDVHRVLSRDGGFLETLNSQNQPMRWHVTGPAQPISPEDQDKISALAMRLSPASHGQTAAITPVHLLGTWHRLDGAGNRLLTVQFAPDAGFRVVSHGQVVHGRYSVDNTRVILRFFRAAQPVAVDLLDLEEGAGFSCAEGARRVRYIFEKTEPLAPESVSLAAEVARVVNAQGRRAREASPLSLRDTAQDDKAQPPRAVPAKRAGLGDVLGRWRAFSPQGSVILEIGAHGGAVLQAARRPQRLHGQVSVTGGRLTVTLFSGGAYTVSLERLVRGRTLELNADRFRFIGRARLTADQTKLAFQNASIRSALGYDIGAGPVVQDAEDTSLVSMVFAASALREEQHSRLAPALAETPWLYQHPGAGEPAPAAFAN